MEIKILTQSDNELEFVLSGVTPTEANTLRRLIVNEVPVLAIEDVSIIKNGSALYDEIIAHRLGLIPLKTDLKSYRLQADCKCSGKGCAQCTLHLTLSAKGPCTVYASEIVSKDPKIKPVHPGMPIVKLLKKQALEFEAVAVMGVGKDHMKFSPGHVYYRGMPEIKLGAVEDKQAVVEVCPTNVFTIEKERLVVKDSKNCILCSACMDVSKAITVQGSTREFLFSIESWGQLTPKEMLVEAMDIFDEKLKQFQKLLAKV